MDKATADGTARTIESLTKNLLECYEELDLLYRVTRRMSSSLDVQRNMDLVLREAMEIFAADMGWLLPAGEGLGKFVPVQANAPEELVAFLQESVVGKLLEEGKSRMFYGLAAELGPARADLPDSFLCALLRTEQTVYGVLCAGRRDAEDMFTAGDLKLANALASQAAISLENFTLNLKRIEEQETMIRMQEELRLALDIQANLLPKSPPVCAGYDIAGRSLPAMGVGGDYYDFIPMEDGRVAVCLGDVSGKGLPAALLMASLQATVRGQTLMNASPSECLHRSNTILYHSTDSEKFATCFFGILDTARHRLCYANAGHEHPVLFGRDGGHSALDTGGLVLGILPKVAFPEGTTEIAPGEVLLVYSDGISEALDAADREFGVARMLGVVAEHREAPAADLVERILRAVSNHAGARAPSDDRTLVVIKRT